MNSSWLIRALSEVLANYLTTAADRTSYYNLSYIGHVGRSAHIQAPAAEGHSLIVPLPVSLARRLLVIDPLETLVRAVLQ